MTLDNKTQIRYRLNVSYSVKGIQTTDSTAELVGPLDDPKLLTKFLTRQTIFQKKVDNLYPPPPKN